MSYKMECGKCHGIFRFPGKYKGKHTDKWLCYSCRPQHRPTEVRGGISMNKLEKVAAWIRREILYHEWIHRGDVKTAFDVRGMTLSAIWSKQTKANDKRYWLALGKKVIRIVDKRVLKETLETEQEKEGIVRNSK